MRGMSKLVYSVYIEPLPKGGFYITIPAFPECRSRAKTFDSALKKARLEIENHLKMLAKARKPIPTESQNVRPLCLPIRVELPRKARTVLTSQLRSR
jgi:predicted RNase H-like HicB family nuclease